MILGDNQPLDNDQGNITTCSNKFNYYHIMWANVSDSHSDENDFLVNPPSQAAARKNTLRTRQVVSIAHDDIVAGRIRYVHVDIQYSQGESKIQISAVVLGANLTEVGKFNEFMSSDCDGPLSTSMTINEVWARFVQFVETNIGRDRTGMLLAWGGEASKFFSLHRCQVWSTAAWHASGPQ
eukprot:scaffold13625_cov53-Cyclotella_meneghiniana.AAC.1